MVHNSYHEQQLWSETLAVYSALACAGPSFGEHFALESVRKLVRVADPQISPDGKSIVAAVCAPDYEDDRFDTELVLIDAPPINNAC